MCVELPEWAADRSLRCAGLTMRLIERWALDLQMWFPGGKTIDNVQQRLEGVVARGVARYAGRLESVAFDSLAFVCKRLALLRGCEGMICLDSRMN